MRASLVLAALFSFGCGAKAPLPSGEPFRASDAAASFAAYQACCGMCEEAETCCKALAQPPRHVPGALVSCSNPEAS